MKVSRDKDQHLKAERKCLSAAATEWSVTRDQTPGTNLRISHIHVLLTGLGQHVPLKINVGFAKVWQRFFSGEDSVFHVKEFRTTLISIDICLYIYIYACIGLQKFTIWNNIHLQYINVYAHRTNTNHSLVSKESTGRRRILTLRDTSRCWVRGWRGKSFPHKKQGCIPFTPSWN